MAKRRVAISIDDDVLRFIDAEAAKHREERSRFINRHFAELMTASGALTISADIPTPAPAAKPKRKRAG